LFLCAATAASGQSPAPGRAGRLSYVEGTVSVRAPGDDQWSPAQLNLPITTGTTLWTEPGARAEVEIGATTVRLDGETELDVTRLDDQAIVIAVPEGAANVHRARPDDGPMWIDGVNGAVVVAEPGFYRVADGGVVRAEGAPTDFDRWAMAREAAAAQAAAATLRYVSPTVTGYQDLAANGDWTVTPDYGAVWVPRAVPVGWAPYRYGHWAYVLPWGWTWIDDAPWGFAPFHYGRWVSWHGRWAWWPGERHARPVYVPAHVVIVLGGHDRHAPPRRWIPLAPREVAPRVAVDVHVDGNRFANHRAASSLPRSAAHFTERPGAPAPRPVVARGATEHRDDHRDFRRDDSHHGARSSTGRDVRRVAPAVAPGAPVSRAAAPRAVERPDPEATVRVNRAEDHRRPPETRVAPAIAAPQERARFAAPPPRREVTREQNNPAVRAEATAPRATNPSAPERRGDRRPSRHEAQGAAASRPQFEGRSQAPTRPHAQASAQVQPRAQAQPPQQRVQRDAQQAPAVRAQEPQRSPGQPSSAPAQRDQPRDRGGNGRDRRGHGDGGKPQG
jgi:hypothetical protein